MIKIYLGTLGIPKEKMKLAIKTAIDEGFWGIDTAWIYKNEDLIGKVVHELTQEGYKIKLQTKIWPTFFENVNAIFEKQLASLKTNKVYSLMLHRPSFNILKSVNAWKQLIQLQKEGKVKHIGVSNFDKDMIKMLINKTGVKPEFNQIEMSITNFREDRYVYNTHEEIEIQGWSPMGKNIQQLLNLPSVVQLSKKYNVTPATIAISYLASLNIVPIVASSSPEHIKEFKHIVQLTSEEIAILKKDNKYQNKYSETY